MISIIAAMANNRAIGNNNHLPWHLPADLKYFKHKTLGHTIIMGRKNYESIGRPLPQRTNIVISRNPRFEASGCIVVDSLDTAIKHAADDPEIFIIGGAMIYQQSLPMAHRLYLTLIDAEVQGDVFFPEFDLKEWREISREHHGADTNNPYAYSFVVLERIGD